MSIAPFTGKDFRVFDRPGFAERMAALRSQVRPKLEGLGEAVAPELHRIVGVPFYAHVARHARRTVNPPDDTGVAFGADRRGYEKTPHFKVAISRHCVRFLGNEEWRRLGEALVRTRDGQLVLGRRVEAAEAARWDGAAYTRAARETFAVLRDCFRLP